ncbi:MAG: ribonuclease HI [Deltaproteobacteria bacterium]|nr:ribonuclease HI [Deltaproteobacteria bacterium]
MSFKEMQFKGNKVYVEVDESGHICLENGRARMRYKPDAGRVYSPSVSNLTEMDGTKPTPAADTGQPVPAKKRKPAAAAAAKIKRAVAEIATMPQKNTVVAYTDGACIGNPGPAGLGYAIAFPDGRLVHKGEPLGNATNNIAELAAIARVLDLVEDPSMKILIHTDSEYSIGVLVRGWKAKANQELIGRIRKTLSRFPKVELRKVKGHAGIPENELVDDLARLAAETQAPVNENNR